MHDASVTLLINDIYTTPKHPTFTDTCYNIVFAQFVLPISQGAASFDVKGYLGGLGTAYLIMVSIATSEILLPTGYSY